LNGIRDRTVALRFFALTEYVMKSDVPERLVSIIERAYRPPTAFATGCAGGN
jgi:hypothetical protein